jgi:trehalose 6-phosphate phosphatase
VTQAFPLPAALRASIRIHDHARTAPPALLLDLDGSLLELAPRPDAVVVPAHLRPLLAALAVRLRGAIAIVSGRPIAVIDALLDPFRSAAAGLHGAEIRLDPAAPVVKTTSATPPDALLAHVPALREYAGEVLLEDKGACLALHHAFSPDRLQEVRGQLAQAIAELAPDLDLVEGRRVLEIKPRLVDKGDACRRLLSTAAFRGRFPIYIGDDITDIDAFRAVAAAGGLTVAVGSRVTPHAAARLAAPADVWAWLRELSNHAWPGDAAEH